MWMTSNVPSLLRTRPLKPWIGWSANGGVIPLIGLVPSAAPLGSLPGRKVSAGSEAKFVNVACFGPVSGAAVVGGVTRSAGAVGRLGSRVVRRPPREIEGPSGPDALEPDLDEPGSDPEARPDDQ